MPRYADLSLRIKLGLLVAGLMAVVMTVVSLYSAIRLDARTHSEAERRADGIATVLAAAIAQDLDRNDVASVTALLGELSRSPDLVYAAVRRGDGSLVTGWKGDAAPATHPIVGDHPLLETSGDVLHVVAGVRAKAPAALQMGWSLEQQRRTGDLERFGAALLGLALFVVGVGVSAFFGRLLVRPIQDLTHVARNIVERGDLSQQIRAHGRDEVGSPGTELEFAL